MKRKSIITLSLIALLVFAVTATSSAWWIFGGDEEKKKKDGEVTITFSTGIDNTGTDPLLIKKFEEKYPNINVKLIEQPSSSDTQHDTYVTKLSAGSSSIDVMNVDVIWPAEFAAAGWLEPLNKYFTEEEINKFLPGPIDAVTYKGKMYAVPWFTDAGMLYYRKDIVKDAPDTWSELYTKAKKYMGKKGTTMGFTFQAKQYEGLVCDILEYFWSNGGAVLNDQGKVVIDSPENLQALKFVKKLVQSKVTPPGITTFMEESSRRPFTEGKAVFNRNWPYVWSIAQSKGSPVKGKVGIAPMPRGPQGDSGAATLGGWNLAINKYSEHKEAAVKFVKFMTSYKMQAFNAIKSSRIPTRKAVYHDKEVLEVNPYYKDMYNVFINAKPRPVTPMYPQISDVIQVEVHKVINGMKSADKALETMQKKIEKLMNMM
ncbi:ABC-type sugar transport system, periplasmic component [Halobacteroides halobius DSM 5150]|uniref:ABC-type sugar transport system, periplasmic component n=1 Tax=Halobacteroides halobius (strain ATCC 35273 / DSM 5150 / MD-1) TaxID=748449 RepID=L0K880_HALHC|nr:ABC transporter substrate-binding protein [Halobacteroides halobius]AGB41487.1 ABC-type sugar transport system, periplasmic component [Halobacteroides halobius DSM 5150]